MNVETGSHLTEEERGEIQPYSKCVVLGSGFREDKPDNLTLDAKIRALAAGVLAKKGKVGGLIFTGAVMPHGSESISRAMRDYMLEKFPDLADFDIQLEEKAMDTIQNAEFTAEMIPQDQRSSVLVLSNKYHLGRAADDFRRVGIDAEVISAEELVGERSEAHKSLMKTYMHSGTYLKSEVLDFILREINKVSPDLLTKLAEKMRSKSS